MKDNEVIRTMMKRKSVRKYRPDMPDRETVETIVRAGQKAPFAAQMYSIILRTKGGQPFGAPISFVICVDAHKIELFMKKRGWEIKTNPLTMLLLGMQDASYMAENMVIAAESFGLGSCFLGALSMSADHIGYIVKKCRLPDRVLPIVELVMGYPAEDEPTRPRYPLNFALFENEYPDIDEETLKSGMEAMDSGYLAQDYYRRGKCMIKLDAEEAVLHNSYNYDNYSWTEHISRKWSHYEPDPGAMLAALKERGFDLSGKA